jgi:hypothetical protein
MRSKLIKEKQVDGGAGQILVVEHDLRGDRIHKLQIGHDQELC